METKYALSLVLSLLGASSLACTSVNPYIEHRLTLEESVGDLQAGRYQESVFRLQQLLAETSVHADDFALQRFFAAYLLTDAHTRASHEGPFLREHGTQTSFSKPGASQPSRLGHLMAMTYNSGFGRSDFERAQTADLEHLGEKKLPDTLEAMGTERALTYLNLCFMAVHAELDFQDRIDEFLSGADDWTELERCEALMEEVALPRDVRPWVYLAIFEYQKKRDERSAYRFAIRARESGAEASAFGNERRDQLAHWITQDASFQFVSPANQPFDPALEGCTVTGTPNLMYEAVPKPD